MVGAYQVEITKLAGQITQRWTHLPTVHYLENAAALEVLSTAPESVLSDSKGLIVSDEVQRLQNF